MRLALCQLNPTVGDIDANARDIADAYAEAVDAGAHLVATGELALTGYPPEDLVLKPAFIAAGAEALRGLAAKTGAVPLIVGFVERLDPDAEHPPWRPVASEATQHPPLANAAAVCRDGVIEAVYRKQRLPNYGVFDEARYFFAGSEPVVVEAGGTRVGVTICEDLWGAGGPLQQACEAGAEVLLSLNASPYSRGKRADRERWVADHAARCGTTIAYLNCVGGQDEVVFDGDSFVMDAAGEVLVRGPQFEPGIVCCDLPLGVEATGGPAPAAPLERLDPLAETYAALVLAVRDYVRKNGFTRVVLGVSGGIDSALVFALAADALGGANVTGLAMPSPHSSDHSLADARDLVERFGGQYVELPIAPAMDAYRTILADAFAGTEEGVAEENVQARIRGMLVMAWSNKFGDLALATGNKSEAAVGYATLYGDMAGGFAPIKDVPKLLVYELSRHRNASAGTDLIPQSTIDKAPSAELKPGQEDTDSLPPYEVLDQIIEAYVEDDRSVADIIASGFDADVVRHVTRLIDGAEFKRRQAAPGVKITDRAFGRDRRLPITQRWRG